MAADPTRARRRRRARSRRRSPPRAHAGRAGARGRRRAHPPRSPPPRRARACHSAYQCSSASSSSSGWNCTPQERSPARKPSPEPAGEASSSDGPAGEREAVLVPVDARGARRERAEDGVALGGRERPQLEPVEMASRQPPHLAAERVGEQLGAEAHAEHGHAALRGLAQQRRLRLQIGVGRRSARRPAPRSRRPRRAPGARRRRAGTARRGAAPRRAAPGRRGPGTGARGCAARRRRGGRASRRG